MDKGVIYGQVSVFFSVELIDILSQVQPADAYGDIYKFSGSNVDVILNMIKTLKKNSHSSVNNVKTIE